ncbi:MAG: 23S rRNA (uracil(1939)-C(5))-methyltransferase RlmD [Lachnospiraceae bacterium]|nr:23S rRNA (uracil(1939)-C(5))-methyltransferase RlmD [Lachnospiraceae bacterium]
MAQLIKNETVVLEIIDIGTDGEGIGFLTENEEHVDKTDTLKSNRGFAVFVKDAVVGDVVEAKLVKVKKNYAYARLEKVIKPSSFRVEPRCQFHRQCGGCQIQALDYNKQLEFKENKVKNNLIRIGGFDESFIEQVMEPIVGMEEPYHYRNKAQYPVGYDRDGNLITGFYAGRTHSIIANTNCALGVPGNEEILQLILAYMKSNHVSAYREETGEGLVRHILIRTGFKTGQIMVCMIVNGKGLPNEQALIDALIKIPGMTSISINTNTENTNVIMGKSTRTLWGTSYIEDKIRDITFRISPQSFYQVNPVQTEKLYGLALEYAGLTGKENVWDLYCGIGTISLFLATKAKKVYGVEIVPQAIEDAKENARINGITNAEFYVGKAEEVLPEQYEKNQVYAEVIVVDPPRKGCDEVCLSTMLKMQPERIVYVSCDSATLARDLKILCEGGYELKKVRPVDQFGHTTHVETVCLLSKLHEAKHHVKITLDR